MLDASTRCSSFAGVFATSARSYVDTFPLSLQPEHSAYPNLPAAHTKAAGSGKGWNWFSRYAGRGATRPERTANFSFVKKCRFAGSLQFRQRRFSVAYFENKRRETRKLHLFEASQSENAGLAGTLPSCLVRERVVYSENYLQMGTFSETRFQVWQRLFFPATKFSGIQTL